MKSPLLVRVPLDGAELLVHLRLKPSGLYHADWWQHGRHFNRSTKQRILGLARTAAGLMAKRAAGQATRSGLRPQLPLAAAVAQYLAARFPGADPRHRHFQGTSQRLTRFADLAGPDLNLAALSYDAAVGVVQKFFEARAKTVKSRSLKNDRSALTAFCNWLLRTRGPDGAPRVAWRFSPAASKEISIPKSPVVLKPALSDAQAAACVAACVPLAGTPASAPRAPLIWRSILLCLGAGARPIEAARAQWSEFDPQAGTLILRGKNMPRNIPLSKWVLDELKKLPPPAHAAETIVGPGLDPKLTAAEVEILNADNQQLRMTRFRKAKALPALVTLQALRRTAARRAAPAMTPQQYSEYFGHSLTVAVKHYIGYGLFGAKGAQHVLDFSPATEKTTEPRKRKRA